MHWASTLDPNLSLGQSGDADNNNQNVVGYSNVSFSETGYRFYQVSMINGHIDPFDGNFREAISLINQFADLLHEQKSVHDVSIVTLPLDVSSNASLQGDAQAKSNSAEFSIRVVLGIGDENVNDIDWNILRGSLIALISSLIVSGSLLSGSFYFEGKMKREYENNNSTISID